MAKYTDKIQQYVDGEMTAQEAATFEQEVKIDTELAYEVKLHQLAVAGVQHSEKARLQAFKARMKAIENEEKDETPIVQLKPKRPVGRWILGIAAGVLMLVAVYFLLQPVSNPITPYAQNVAQVENVRGTNSPMPSTDFDRAKQLYNDKKQNEALQALTLIAEDKESPYRYQAMLLRADIFYEQGDKDLATKELEKIMEGNDVSLRDIAKEIIEKL